MLNNIKDLKTKEEVLDFISNYLEHNIDLLTRKMESEDSFEKLAWASYQAHLLGSLKALKKLKAVIPDREKK